MSTPMGTPMTWRRCWPLVALMLLTWLLVSRWTSVPPTVGRAPDLELGVPTHFGGWQMVATELSHVSVLTTADGLSPYDQQVVRTYRGADGQLVMLTLAYGQAQSKLSRIHDPEGCYPGAGFELLNITRADPTEPLPVQRLLARRGQRIEAVSYWIRTGDIVSAGSAATRWYLLKERLQGRVPDGILVRASAVMPDTALAAATHAQLETFLAELIASSPVDIRHLLRS